MPSLNKLGWNARECVSLLLLCGFLSVPQADAEPEMIVLPTDGASLSSSPSSSSWARAISADGSTMVGEINGSAFRYSTNNGVELFLTNAGIAGNPEVALVKPDQTALAVSADGSVVVGYLSESSGVAEPYRWSADTGIDRLLENPDLPLVAQSGAALDVSADGSVVVGVYANSPSGDAECRPFSACRVISSFARAFRWQRESDADRFEDLASTLSPGDSRALSVSGVGQSERILFEQERGRITCNNGDCSSLTPGGRHVLFDASGQDLLAGQLFADDVAIALSADGTNVAGSAGSEGLPFRWNDVTGVQVLGRRGGSSVYGFSDREARGLSADGRLVVGDFGVWFEGRTARLKNLLVNGFGLSVLGWDFEQYYREQFFTGFGAPPIAPIGPGLHATSDAGDVWAGVALSPQGIPRAIMVRTDSLVTTEFLDGLPAAANSLALASATLPHARMSRVGDTVSVFATLVNVSDIDLQGCGVALRGDLPLTMHIATTDPATNATTGELDAYFSLPAGAAQSVVLAFTPTDEFDSQRLPLVFDCGNKETRFYAGSASDVWMGAASSLVVDILAVSRTITADGIVRLDENLHGAFVVATQNLGGATGVVEVIPSYRLGLSQIAVCETESATGACLAPVQQAPLMVSYAPGQQRTFAVFMAASRPWSFSSIDRRATLEFRQMSSLPNGSVVGSTSVALSN